MAFQSGTDKVDLGRIDSDPAAAGDQAFHFTGDSAFTGRAGELRLSYNEELARWEAEGDLDGDASADFLLLFTETNLVTASDFML